MSSIEQPLIMVPADIVVQRVDGSNSLFTDIQSVDNASGVPIGDSSLLSPSPHFQDAGISYTRLDGTIEYALNGADAIARCPVLGKMASDSPEQVGILLELATLGKNALARKEFEISNSKVEKEIASNNHHKKRKETEGEVIKNSVTNSSTEKELDLAQTTAHLRELVDDKNGSENTNRIGKSTFPTPLEIPMVSIPRIKESSTPIVKIIEKASRVSHSLDSVTKDEVESVDDATFSAEVPPMPQFDIPTTQDTSVVEEKSLEFEEDIIFTEAPIVTNNEEKIGVVLRSFLKGVEEVSHERILFRDLPTDEIKVSFHPLNPLNYQGANIDAAREVYKDKMKLHIVDQITTINRQDKRRVQEPAMNSQVLEEVDTEVVANFESSQPVIEQEEKKDAVEKKSPIIFELIRNVFNNNKLKDRQLDEDYSDDRPVHEKTTTPDYTEGNAISETKFAFELSGNLSELRSALVDVPVDHAFVGLALFLSEPVSISDRSILEPVLASLKNALSESREDGDSQERYTEDVKYQAEELFNVLGYEDPSAQLDDFIQYYGENALVDVLGYVCMEQNLNDSEEINLSRVVNFYCAMLELSQSPSDFLEAEHITSKQTLFEDTIIDDVLTSSVDSEMSSRKGSSTEVQLKDDNEVVKLFSDQIVGLSFEEVGRLGREMRSLSELLTSQDGVQTEQFARASFEVAPELSKQILTVFTSLKVEEPEKLLLEIIQNDGLNVFLEKLSEACNEDVKNLKKKQIEKIYMSAGYVEVFGPSFEVSLYERRISAIYAPSL